MRQASHGRLYSAVTLHCRRHPGASPVHEPERPAPDPQPTRREIVGTFVALAVTPLAGAAADPPADAIAPMAAALTELARLRFGKHPSEDDLKHVRRNLMRDQYGA